MPSPAAHRQDARAIKRAVVADPAVRAVVEALGRRAFRAGADERLTLTHPELGNRTPILFVERASGERLVVRLLPDLWSLLRTAVHGRCLAGWGVPVAALRGVSLRARWSAARRFALLEDFVPGMPFNRIGAEERPAALAACARTLAALHSRRRRAHGPLFLPRRGSYVEAYLPVALSRVARVAERLPAAEAEALERDLLAAAARVGRRARHELLHGHVYRNNFLLHEGRAWLVDLEGLHYGDAAQDLVRALLRLCRHEPEAEGVFLDAYFAAVRGPTREDLHRQRPFYEADAHLGRATRALRFFERGDWDEATFHTRFDAALRAARAAL